MAPPTALFHEEVLCSVAVDVAPFNTQITVKQATLLFNFEYQRKKWLEH